MGSDVIISIRDLVKSFRAPDGHEVRILDGVTFDVFRSETLVIMGGSGCGKSTLLNCLIGEYSISGGQILFRTERMPEPRDLAAMNESETNELRKRFGILFQSGALFNSITVAQNVALPIKEHSQVPDRLVDTMVTVKLNLVRMLEHRDKMPAQLSGGQKKRVGLARATAMDPEILFYDEPSAGLDPVTSAAIDDLIMDLSGKLAVTSVVVTHEMDSAFRIADRMVMLHQGRVLKIATRAEFETLRSADPVSLSSRQDQLINQFLNGYSAGPLTDEQGRSQYEQLLISG